MGERSGEDGLFAQAQIAPLTGLAESLGIDRATWIQTATEPLPETLRLTMHHYDIDWTRQQLLAMGATPLSWSVLVGCKKYSRQRLQLHVEHSTLSSLDASGQRRRRWRG